MLQAMNSLSGKLNNPIEQVYPELEDLEITPSIEQQNFKSKKYGYNNVTVKAVESEELSIVPSAEEQVKEGIFNKVIVHGEENLIPENIKEGAEIFGIIGTAELKGEENAIIDCKKLLQNTSTSNDSYVLNKMITKIPKNIDISNWKSTAFMFKNCSSLTDLDLSSFNTNNVTNMQSMFSDCSSLTDLDLSNFNTSKVTGISNMFEKCTSLKNIDLSNFDTSNVTDISYMFNSCSLLTDLDLSNFDMSKVNYIPSMLYYCSSLTNLKCFKNLGKGYTLKSSNYNSYRLDLSTCTKLTHESLMSVINNLYDLNLTYNVANGGKLYTQSLKLGATNLAKLTAEEIAIATNKRLDGFIERRTKMQFFDYTKPKMMVAEKGKHIRAKNDVYVAEHIDENGLLVEEHVPYYSTTLFVPDTFTEEQMNELYVEENIT